VTIAIAVQVHDGVVLASDSASTLTDTSKPAPDNVINVYNNANKIFNLCKGLPIGAVTFGMGSIGSSSISTLAKDLRRRFSGNDATHHGWKLNEASYTLQEVADQARKFLFEEKYLPLNLGSAPGFQLGFVVAGYSANAELSEVWSVQIQDGQSAPPSLVMGQGTTSVWAGGDPEVFSRLVLGHGLKLADALVKGGVPRTDVDAVVAALRQEMHVDLVEAPMPVQDAIEFAEFLVQTTSAFTRFKRGAATVGGPVESAAITKHEGFKWVQRKHYFSESLNPRAVP
jgi:hypothetical protein